MKKSSLLLVILCLSVLLSACGDKETIRTFESNQNGLKLHFVYKATNNRVTEMTSENVMPYSVIGVTNKKEAKKLIDPIAKQYQNINGIFQTIEYRDTEAIERLKVDFTVVNIEEIKHLPGMMDSGDLSKGIGMKESAKLLLDKGFTEIK